MIFKQIKVVILIIILGHLVLKSVKEWELHYARLVTQANTPQNLIQSKKNNTQLSQFLLYLEENSITPIRKSSNQIESLLMPHTILEILSNIQNIATIDIHSISIKHLDEHLQMILHHASKNT